MTTPLIEAPLPYPAEAEAAPTGPSKLRPPDWLREPLLHFLVLGGLLFAIDHFLVSRADDPRRIVVGPAVASEAVATFEAARGRPPNAEELAALQKVWLDNEVLYREGLALQVDKGDPAIRERVIFKALSVIDSGVKLPAISDEELRSWFEAHRSKYDEPARYDFEEAALSGESSEPAVREFVAALNAGTPGDARAGLRVFKGRPHQNLVESYGPELARALEQANPGEWRALPTKDGFRALRLQKVTPPRPAMFEALRGVVMQDWKDAEASQQRSAAVKALSKKYDIRYETAPEQK
jgi:PPIC-type PPIASE domain